MSAFVAHTETLFRLFPRPQLLKALTDKGQIEGLERCLALP